MVNFGKMIREPGYWQIESVGDDTNRRLGIFYGRFEELALRFANQQGYHLSMKKIPAEQVHVKDIVPTGKKVEVDLDYEGRYASTQIGNGNQLDQIARVYHGRDAIKTQWPLKVTTLGGRVTIELTGEDAIRNAVKLKAMEKLRGHLTPEEMTVLGLLK